MIILKIKKLLFLVLMVFSSFFVQAQYGPNDDFDGDGIINSIDKDDDNDGILDCTEAYSGGVYLTDPFTTVPLELYPNSLVQYTGLIVAGDPAAVRTVASDADGNFGLATNTNEGFSYQFNTNLPVDLTVEPYNFNLAGVFTTNDRITFSSDVPITLNNPVGHLEISTDGGSTWTTPSTYTATSILFRPIGGISAIGVANFNFTMNGATSFTYAMASTGGNPNGSTFRMLVGECSDIDTDDDGIVDRMDLDSDDDGCPDSIEGASDFGWSDLNEDTSLMGDVNTDSASAEYGVPTLAGAGQEVGESENAETNTCICFKDANTGTPDAALVGISTLNRNKNIGANHWPKNVNSALLALDSQEKGLVLPRLTQAQIDGLTMQVGMLVYNIDEDCLMLSDGTSWSCIKQTCPETL